MHHSLLAQIALRQYFDIEINPNMTMSYLLLSLYRISNYGNIVFQRLAIHTDTTHTKDRKIQDQLQLQRTISTPVTIQRDTTKKI